MLRGEKLAWIWVWSAMALVGVVVAIAAWRCGNLAFAHFESFLCSGPNRPVATSACRRIAFDDRLPVALRSTALRRLIEIDGNEPETVIERLSMLIRLGTADAEDWNRRGVTFYWQRDYARAAKDFEQAARMNGAVGQYWANLADVQSEMKDFAAASRNYSTAIERNYDTVEVRGNRGWASHRLGNDASALADYEWAIIRSPESADNFNERGLVRHALGDQAGTLADYDRSLSLAPDDPIVLVNRAITYAHLGNFEKAKQDLDRAAALDRDLFGDTAAFNQSSPLLKRAYGRFEIKTREIPRSATRCDCREESLARQNRLAWPRCAC